MCNFIIFPYHHWHIKYQKEVFLKHIQNLRPKLTTDLHIICTSNESSSLNTLRTRRDHQRPVRRNYATKNSNNIFVKQQKNKINAKPQPSLTKSMPTVDCYSNQSSNQFIKRSIDLAV